MKRPKVTNIFKEIELGGRLRSNQFTYTMRCNRRKESEARQYYNANAESDKRSKADMVISVNELND